MEDNNSNNHLFSSTVYQAQNSVRLSSNSLLPKRMVSPEAIASKHSKRLTDRGQSKILLAPGYQGFQHYLSTIQGDSHPWMTMHDIDGEIIETESKIYYSVFKLTNGSLDDKFGQGLLLTDIDLDKSSGYEIKKAAAWRIDKAMSQRAFYLSLCNSIERIEYLVELESKYSKLNSYNKPIQFPLFQNSYLADHKKTTSSYRSLRQFENYHKNFYYDYKDFGYLTRFSLKHRSRSALVKKGIYTKIGKYIRSPIILSPMPDASGSIDAITTSSFCHMLSIISRNFQFSDPQIQANFAKSVLSYIQNLKIPDDLKNSEQNLKKIWSRNICAAIGTQENDFDRFKLLYNTGIRSFRIYSIATDIRIKVITRKIIKYINDNKIKDIELFIGQITSIEQFMDIAKSLKPNEWHHVNGVFIGNGGGSRCKTAETGMIVNSPYLGFQIKNSGLLDDKSLIVEGGVSTEPAAALLLGANGLSYSAGITGGCIESPGGALYIYSPTKEEYWKPYRGEASPSAKIIEGNVYPTGDAKQVEGANGFVRMEKKYPSMCGRIWIINEWLAQSLVKLGVDDFIQLKHLGVMLTNNEFLKIFGSNASKIPDAISISSKEDGSHFSDNHIIPLPLFRRSVAQKQVASSYGLVGETKIKDVKDIDYALKLPK